MNPELQQAYLKLIRSLLDSPNGEEPEILAANQELLDAGFVQTVEEVAQMCSQHGDEKTANWLQSLAMQLREVLNLDTKVDLQCLNEEEGQAYIQFLMQVLQATADSGFGVYPLLVMNTDKLDEVLAETLRCWGTNRLGEGDADEVHKLAEVIVFFSYLITEFSLGSKASNMEIAIAGYEVALTFYTQQAFPYEWAQTQNNLGLAYRYRIRGEQGQNLEQAISCYQNSLKVYTFDNFPDEWARTQNNLASAYRNRIRGEKAQNLEQAIACSQEALKVRTFDAFPYEWAVTQNILAGAYRYRIRGEQGQNLELAIAYLQNALKVITFDAFPDDWAATQNNLGLAYRDRILGERAENLELVISCYQNALKVYTFDAFPQQWAGKQNNLGLAYHDRIRGKRAENLELAIACFQEALKIYTFDAFPDDWASTQNNLGAAYSERIRGDIAENLELAIACFQEALKIYTFDAFPDDWASTQDNLGTAYTHRIRGKRAENLELAIAYFQEALKIYTLDASPYEWASTQYNLGAAYTHRIRGERAENLELAITCYQKVLKVYTFEAFPLDWAMTQNSLGVAYTGRIRGERAENLELAIACFQEALKVRTLDALPLDWAMTQNNLANSYCQRIRGEKAENLEQAIACHQEVLKVRSIDDFPQQWANTQNNLGTVYIERIIGNRSENLELAIACFQEALKVRTFEAFPVDWAMTQNSLGVAYYKRIRGEQAENLQLAITCCKNALKVRTCEAFPQNYVETLFNLGMGYQNANLFTSAYNTFESAIATVESLREEIVSGEETKRKKAEEWNELYRRMVKVCTELNKITQAIEYVERSKTRNLVEQILERDSKTIFPPEVFTQLEKYRDEIAVGQYQIQNGKAENPKVLAQHLKQLRNQHNELQNQYLPVGYGFKFDSFQATLDEQTAIIEWYILNDKILAFIVTKIGELTVCQSQPEDLEALVNWVNQYLQNYDEQKDQWLNKLGEELKQLASILHIDEILKQIPKHCAQIILIPHTALHLFPLHALPVNQKSENSSCLLDLFAGGVSYAPSCQLLQQVQQRKRPDFQSLFAIQNPTEDLNYTDLEVQVIQSYFNTANVLKKSDATLTAINNSELNTYHCAHFSCHGYFNLTNSSKSALILANAPAADIPTKPDSERYLNLRAGETHDLEKCLTLDKIFALKLENCRLVTLSACETGLIDFENTSDEYIGLPSGFLLAGSKAVVSSLWTVSDLSTAFLMMKFYENLQTLNSVSLALNQAQQWLRNLTTEEFEALLVKYDSPIEEIFAQLPEEKRLVARAILRRMCRRKPHPFAVPFYWAGFTATGL
ncbi:CHAT domain-containing protein [Nostoc sp. FACHB-280]|uniref:CHAT domain-containing protein n=1 Tax=Nostoc sp. FACHB-280 TaxID=2692839 RepID=UPI00168B6E7E|nr:CHAT domain-containing protein [Nostoc sp. FACHB-280]MBD2498653.1 tetratricopeptide repeat protein [Nostoc sp. FACHB-280]